MKKLSNKDIEELRDFLSLGCEYSGTNETVSDLIYKTLQEFDTSNYYGDEIGLTDGENEFTTLNDFIVLFWEKAIDKILNVISTQ